MKLATYKSPAGTTHLGLVVQGGIVQIDAALPDAPRDMIGLIEAFPTWRDRLEALAASGRVDASLATVTLLAPIPRPGKIMAIGLNYADHVAESGMAKPAEQLWFAKMPTAATGPYAPIERPRVSSQLDYEAELAFVIGSRCKHVSRDHARDVIFGYCVSNDVSVRDWQLRTSQFTLGKSFDTHAPFGPWIVTADEVPDPHKLGIRCFVNGEKRQDSTTAQLIFDCYDQVAHLSAAMTLEPGDVVMTGTPGGVGVAHKPPSWLRAGDRVRVEIDGLGEIENLVAEEAAR
ncbi:fumarylacetoacetate hydrolase family protein [Cupriavidus agavae]|uniref:2-keto-4-pentenoate hydratase/2-oxohepta-3-ene-1,7-dioic acid hydratase in catechol pathway n=1 Tax=Cupriavidus agavae TaxID=1001822 RepID=A0A4Q7S115_9BURK|nr:fumarylacetoacetate hydrolase family protein [Cupriavidus agavae]RZT39198.1 2-keto-4-pentenoate hydratase/2-oxohepta-3-ene-1,7-dioic acid hydratase in catechol pathway [Cupriavidus agavae]